MTNDVIDRDTEREPTGVPKKIIIGVVFVVIVGFSANRLMKGPTGGGGTLESNSLHLEDGARDENKNGRLIPPKSKASGVVDDIINRENQALAKASLKSFQSQAQNVLHNVDFLDAEIRKWEKEIQPLLSNEEGRWIAANLDNVRLFKQLYENENLATQFDAGRIRANVNEMLIPVLQGLNDTTQLYTPGTDLANKLNEEHEVAFNSTKEYRNASTSIQALVELGKSQGEKAEITLHTALMQIKASQLKIQAQALAEAQKEAEKKLAKELVEIESEKASREADAEKSVAEAEAKIAEERAQRRIEEVERTRLREMAADPKVKAQFSAFLNKGRYNFGLEATERTIVNGPSFYPSVKNLQRRGIITSLKPFISAAIGLKYGEFNGGYYRYHFGDNDRPFPSLPNPRTDKQWEQWQQRFELFHKLIPYWKEMGLLRD